MECRGHRDQPDLKGRKAKKVNPVRQDRKDLLELRPDSFVQVAIFLNII